MGRILIVIICLLLTALSLSFSAELQPSDNNTAKLRGRIQHVIDSVTWIYYYEDIDDPDALLSLLDSTKSQIQQHFGDQDILMARILTMYVCFCVTQGDYDEGIRYSEKAQAIYDMMPGDIRMDLLLHHEHAFECHIQTNDLTNMQLRVDRMFEILNSFEVPLTPEQGMDYARALNHRGRLRMLQGRYDDALADVRQAVAMITDDMEMAEYWRNSMTGNIAWTLYASGNREEGERMIYEITDFFAREISPTHFNVLLGYHYLAMYAFWREDYATADSLTKLWLAGAGSRYHPLHTSRGVVYATISKTKLAQDSTEAAIEYARRALEIAKAGSDFPSSRLMDGLMDLGNALLYAGELKEATEVYTELAETRGSFLTNVFAYASEEQKLSYMRQSPPLVAQLLSSAIEFPREETNRAVADMVLSGKGVAIDVLAAEQDAAICSEEPNLDSLLEEHRAICNQIANLAISGSAGSGYMEERLTNLYGTKNELEAELSLICSQLGFTFESNKATASDVAAQLAENSVLIDFVKYRRAYIPKIYHNRTNGDHYAAIIIKPDGDIGVVNTGWAVPIDSLLDRYHDIMAEALQARYSGNSSPSMEPYQQVACSLYAYIIEPLGSALEDVKQLYISADGQLNLLPLETLTRDGQHFLVEDYEIVYLSSGRDLLDDDVPQTNPLAVVISNPDYLSIPSESPALASIDSNPLFSSRGETRSPECLTTMLSPLPMTVQEGNRITDLLSSSGRYEVSHFQSTDASEEWLKHLPEVPGVLHLATHGYFCPVANRVELSNPLLRSGLILAGANRTIGGLDSETPLAEDGILTALEVSGMNLVGTDLVVLSACQTGAGDIQNGEGVFGLRRALQHAGARSIITSMFSVPDESTSELMSRFYENWLSGQSKSSALRNASLGMLEERRQKSKSTHPLFWGGFILVGDPN